MATNKELIDYAMDRFRALAMNGKEPSFSRCLYRALYVFEPDRYPGADNFRDEAFLSGLGTLRVCIDCGVIVAGGPTRCVRCAIEGPPTKTQTQLCTKCGQHPVYVSPKGHVGKLCASCVYEALSLLLEIDPIPDQEVEPGDGFWRGMAYLWKTKCDELQTILERLQRM